MDVLRQLLLLCLCVCTQSAPLQDLHYRRSGARLYASDYAADYEPFVYAAIPLHGPIPVMHVLSKRPLSGDRNHAPSYNHPVYARPPRRGNEYASIDNEKEYTAYRYREPQNYLDPYQYSSTYAQQNPAPSSLDEVTILYARPNPHGGYSYRRGPTKTASKKSPTPTTKSPVIIRVHRYRIVRDP